jgi:hypothetical protein
MDIVHKTSPSKKDHEKTNYFYPVGKGPGGVFGLREFPPYRKSVGTLIERGENEQVLP